MNINEKITHQEICQYFEGNVNIEKLNEWATKFPAYGIFTFLRTNRSPVNHQKGDLPLTFGQAENFLEKYLAGTLDKKDANRLTDAIVNSEREFLTLYTVIEKQARVISEVQNISEYNSRFSKNEILLKLKNFRKSNRNKPEFYVDRKKIITGILSVAAVFLILFLIPFELQKDLNDLYNFDDKVPLPYNESTLRGGNDIDEINDPEYKNFKYQFNQGMADYLAKEYSKALKQWKNLEGKLARLKTKPYFNKEDEHNFLLYNALCRIALYLSDDDNFNHKKILLTEADNLFEKLPLNSDIEKYYYALTLALTNKKEKAIKMLNSISENSSYYDKKIVLLEQLNQ